MRVPAGPPGINGLRLVNQAAGVPIPPWEFAAKKRDAIALTGARGEDSVA